MVIPYDLEAQDSVISNDKLKNIKDEYSELFNSELIGLAYDATKDNFYEKYYVEFVT